MILDKIGFTNWLTIKKLSAKTIELYNYYLDRLKLYSSFNQETINEFILKYNNQINRAFIKNYIIYVFENKDSVPHSLEEINEIRDIKLPKITGRKKQRIPLVVSKLQVLAITNAMTSERNKLMTLITFYGGLRLSGLLNIKPYDFQWKTWNLDRNKPLELKVIEKGDKERIVFIPSDIALRTLRWIKNFASKKDNDPSKPIFNMSGRHWCRLIELASFKALGFKIHPHTLRHSAATNLLDSGWNIKEVQEYLGHESIQTTEVYLHIDKSNLKDKFNYL